MCDFVACFVGGNARGTQRLSFFLLLQPLSQLVECKIEKPTQNNGSKSITISPHGLVAAGTKIATGKWPPPFQLAELPN